MDDSAYKRGLKSRRELTDSVAWETLGAQVKGGDSTPALLRAVKETDEGIYISGAKAVGSISSQGNEMILSNLMRPGMLPEESLWLAVPINAPGIHIVCRHGARKWIRS